MTLVDTSAWVEYLRGTESPVDLCVRRLIEQDATLQTTDTVVMEILAGGRNELHTTKLRRLLSRCEFIPTAGLGDYETAAALYRTCRRAGSTIRSLNDCLIAAVAIRTQHAVLHLDRDFEALATHSSLQIAPV